MQSEVIHINAGENRDLLFLNPQNLDIDIELERDARLQLHIISIDGADSANRIRVLFSDKGSEAHLYGLALTSGTQHLGILTEVTHSGGGCTSRQTFKYLLRDQSEASFRGLLKVAPDAQKTDASQTNRNILLSPDARMHTEPQLEIYADDVRCSHGASTGQLDESALFYMQQRCLSADDARTLLLQAFCADILSGINDQQLQEQILEKIR